MLCLLFSSFLFFDGCNHVRVKELTELHGLIQSLESLENMFVFSYFYLSIYLFFYLSIYPHAKEGDNAYEIRLFPTVRCVEPVS